jgi:hypothetical protein
MRWFRDHIRRGSLLALVALAINFGLSFGHVHATDAKRSGHLFQSQIAAVASPDQGQAPGGDESDRADLLCPICTAAGAIAHALNSAPPALPIVLALSSVDVTVEPDLAVPQPPRAAFQSRGPPIS